ncbi:MAG: hypothetical protein K0R39_1540 [Symbiobacteriaceae bacterium]|jgi:hypothetical protein|nr:hypothetical protein [Symbiobacteriaceae bacterium]
MKMSFRSFSLPIVVVVVLLLGASLLGRQFLAAAPAADVTTTNWGDLKVVEGKEHGPRTWKAAPLATLPPVPTPAQAYAWNFFQADLSKLDLSRHGAALSKWATFDLQTKWPAALPPEFQPAKALELGKDPGLGVRALHAQGITGKGIHVAILDQTLLTDHKEYAGRVIKYTEVGEVAPAAEMHGAAVTSLLVGKQIGVAPEAQVTYYAVQFVLDWKAEPIKRTFRPMAATINKILDDNKNLPADQRIRVISVSIGAGPDEDGYAEVMQAYKRAIAEGVLVVTTDMDNRYKYAVHGLGRDALKDPNDPKSYEPGSWWADSFFRSGGQNWRANVYAPMDSRTVAGSTGLDHYRFDRTGGLSWSVPWMAGVYALACQVNPAVTPDQFLKAANDTGDTITVSRDGKEYKLGPIMNPAKIIAAVKK